MHKVAKLQFIFLKQDDLEKRPLLVGETASILVRVNKPFSSLTWVVVARGVVVSWERVSLPDPLQETTLSIPLGLGSEPEANVLIYTVLEASDDVVAESMKIGNEKSTIFRHMSKILTFFYPDVKGAEEKMLRVGVKDYSELNKTAEPGANVSIFFENVVSGGLLALRGVDQSVLLLKEDKDVDGGTIKYDFGDKIERLIKNLPFFSGTLSNNSFKVCPVPETGVGRIPSRYLKIWE